MIIIDKLCYTSKLRYTNASVKTALAIITLLVCVIGRSIALSVCILFAMGYLTIHVGGISPSHYIKLMRIPLIFLFLSTIAIIINFSKTPLSAFAIPVGNIFITSSRSSLLFAAQLILTALASVSCLYYLSLSTPITDILTVFRRIHCPEILIELMLLIYRFIFVLLDIADSLTCAQRSRLGNVNLKTSCRSMGNLISALFIRAFKKSSFLFDAMESRCYDGTIHVLEENYPAKKNHIIYMIVFELTLIILSVILRICGLHI